MKTIFVFLCLALAFTSCKKDNPVSTTEDPNGYSNYELRINSLEITKNQFIEGINNYRTNFSVKEADNEVTGDGKLYFQHIYDVDANNIDTIAFNNLYNLNLQNKLEKIIVSSLVAINDTNQNAYTFLASAELLIEDNYKSVGKRSIEKIHTEYNRNSQRRDTLVYKINYTITKK